MFYKHHSFYSPVLHCAGLPHVIVMLKCGCLVCPNDKLIATLLVLETRGLYTACVTCNLNGCFHVTSPAFSVLSCCQSVVFIQKHKDTKIKSTLRISRKVWFVCTPLSPSLSICVLALWFRTQLCKTPVFFWASWFRQTLVCFISNVYNTTLLGSNWSESNLHKSF